MTITTLHGDCREVLQTLPAGSVQTVVTSPPYYGLRKYGNDPREIGQEATPALYVAALVEVFRQVRRVLRDDGVVWLNLGDSYNGGGPHHGDNNLGKSGTNKGSAGGVDRRVNGLKEKDLLGIPWRVAFALQDDGWFLRSDIIWAKPNCMPESVTDRPTRAHEYVFLLTKSARYFYDAAAIAESAQGDGRKRGPTSAHTLGLVPGQTPHKKLQYQDSETDGTRNKRTVWTIATQPYSGAHYATMPEALIAPCVLAGSSAQACETCGAAWGRVVERSPGMLRDRTEDEGLPETMNAHGIRKLSGKAHAEYKAMNPDRDLGFAPRCTCPANTGSARSVVLDPFGGSGTVGLVAMRYQRDAVLIELNQVYIDDHIETRTDGVQVELFV